MQTVALLVTGLAVLLTVPVAAFFIEVSAASVLSQRRAISPNNVFDGTVAVLGPAHD